DPRNYLAKFGVWLIENGIVDLLISVRGRDAKSDGANFFNLISQQLREPRPSQLLGPIGRLKHSVLPRLTVVAAGHGVANFVDHHSVEFVRVVTCDSNLDDLSDVIAKSL